MKKSKEVKCAGQSDTYTSTSKSRVNLQRNRTLHFQIGLILTLLAVIFLIEIKTPVVAMTVPDSSFEDETVVYAVEFTREQPKTTKKVIKQVQPEPKLDDFEKVEDDTKLVEDVLDLPSQDEPVDQALFDPSSVPVIDDPVTIEDVPFALIEDAPIFPGCEAAGSNEARKTCFNQKLQKLISRKFNGDVIADAGLTGEYLIHVQFKVDTQGDIVDIKTRAPHPRLDKEARRVVQLIPKMIPGMQRKVPVGVIYQLPIRIKG
ncbi:MAG: energy transducer TonB [Dokdonia sp.]|jgi:protein TonB